MATYTIRDLSARYGVSAPTLRYYEQIGLLENVLHNDQKQRVYTEEHLVRLDAIQCFKQTGLPLKKIKEFFQYEKELPRYIDNVVDMMKEHEESIQKEIQMLQEGLCHIQHKTRYYSGIQTAIREGTSWPCWEDCGEPAAPQQVAGLLACGACKQ